MDLLLFGSLGSVVESGRLERLAFNAAFKELGLNLYWNVATYCKVAAVSSGPEALMDLSADDWATGLADEVHDCKLRHLAAYLEGGIVPREGVLETIALCKQEGIGLGLIADSSEDQVQLILDATSGLNAGTFDRVFTAADLPARLPDSTVYPFVIEHFACPANNVVAIADSSLNQASALMAGIQCYLYPGEYAAVERDILLTRDLTRTVEMAHRLWAYDSTATRRAPSESIGAQRS